MNKTEKAKQSEQTEKEIQQEDVAPVRRKGFCVSTSVRAGARC